MATTTPKWIRWPRGLGVAVGSALLATACSGSSTDAPAAAPAAPAGATGNLPQLGPDVPPPADVTLHPDVVVIRGGLSVLHSVSVDHSVWTLDAAAPGVASLTVGKIALLTGLDVARVTAVNVRGKEVDLTVEPVAIVDVVTEGAFSWDKTSFTPANAVTLQGPSPLYATSTARTSAPVPPSARILPQGGPASKTLTVNLTDQWSVEVASSVAPMGAVDLAITGKRAIGGESGASGGGKASLGSVEVGLTAAVHIDNIGDTTGSFSVNGGAMNDASVSANITGHADAEVSAKTSVAGQFPDKALIKVPVATEWVVWWGGIPVYLSVAVAFSIQPSLATKDSGIALKGRLEFGGSAGISVSGGSGSKTGNPTITPPPDLAMQASALPSAGTTAIVFALQAPRIGVGLGTLSAFPVGAKAGLFADVVNSFGLTVASATAPVPCEALNWIAAVHAGGEVTVKLFGGISITGETSYEVYKTNKDWYVPDLKVCQP